MSYNLSDLNKTHHGIIQNSLDYDYVFTTLQRPVKALHLDLLDIQDLSGGGDLIGCCFDPSPTASPDQISSLDHQPMNLVWVQANPIPDKQNQSESMIFKFCQPIQLERARLRFLTNGTTPLVPGPSMKIKWRLTLFYCDY